MRPFRSSRPRPLAAAAAALTVASLLLWPGPGIAADGTSTATAATTPAAASPTQASAFFRSGSVRGIATFFQMTKPGEGLTGAAVVAMYGVDKAASHALVLARQPCGTPVSQAAGTLRLPGIDGTAKTAAFSTRRDDIAGLLPYIEQSAAISVRLRRTSAPRGQVACADATLYGPEAFPAATGGIAAYELKNVQVASFKRGIVLARVGAANLSLSYVLFGQAPGSHRIVAADEPCGTSIAAGDVVATRLYFEDSVRTARVKALAPVTGDPLAIASIRLFKGTTGFSKPEGCSNIIGVLVAL